MTYVILWIFLSFMYEDIPSLLWKCPVFKHNLHPVPNDVLYFFL